MENTHNTQAQVQALGRGTIGFNADGTCFGQVRIGNNVIGVKGQYNAATATLEGPGVVVNLATNARDAMTPKGSPIARDGKLMVRTSVIEAAQARAMGHNPMEDGKYVMIEVEDTGGGIKPEHAAKIFRPYHSTKEAGKGTGLGLATGYGIIKQSGGYIFFTSKVGVGTTFRIFLPEYTPTQEELDEIAAKERALIAPQPQESSVSLLPPGGC